MVVDLDSSGERGGQISARQIDLELSGALNNRKGLIESRSTLATAAASLDNLPTGHLSVKEVEGINKVFEKNMVSGREKVNIIGHLEKADIVPVDFRVLNDSSQRVFLDYIKALSAGQ
ncbi:hypothetical protein [Pseudomonas sp. Fl4BN1]|uniref:hypothetical protein n=1 Tax=Pseudomonas sp. Fl4BN1 TaxID=2697651 RepID=UPI001376FA07|nr:hypothetical protein [Pseudomonas sp. Fl4BN1]NBF10938.1 hypothetical protein [Pseudomonas sp. Fl4BN1]